MLVVSERASTQQSHCVHVYTCMRGYGCGYVGLFVGGVGVGVRECVRLQ